MACGPPTVFAGTLATTTIATCGLRACDGSTNIDNALLLQINMANSRSNMTNPKVAVTMLLGIGTCGKQTLTGTHPHSRFTAALRLPH